MRALHTEILRVLLYYDIWSYPLTVEELFRFLPLDSISFEEFLRNIHANGPGPNVGAERGYYYVRGSSSDIVAQREQKERHARRLWIGARISMHIIKRFPFVRGIFVSGDLSKNFTTPKSDVDFFVITEPDRLWVARMLLIMFKKIFLLNRKKYFCLNYFASSDHLTLDEQNIFLATEIAHLKPLYNSTLFAAYFEANNWIRTFFPNFAIEDTALSMTNNRSSFVQRLIEVPFSLFPTGKLDTYLLTAMKRVWAKRYPEYDDETRERIFRCTKGESRAYAGNFEEKILVLYNQKLKQFGVSDREKYSA
jgi:hypothetical protein